MSSYRQALPNIKNPRQKRKPFFEKQKYINTDNPVDKQMVNRPEVEWIKIAVENEFPYKTNDEINYVYWFRDVMRYLRKRLMTHGVVYFPDGRLVAKIVFDPYLEQV